jgi:hypothetical protein
MTFRPCDACGRHVRLSEACPFCHGKRPGRLLVASVLGLGLVACSPSPVPVHGPDVPSVDAGAPESAAPETAAPESAAPESAAPESTEAPPVALYGMPPQ